MAAVAQRLADALQGAVRERGAGCAALSGGSTPAPAYRALASATLDWPKITFALVDERFVPPTDPASNQGMIMRALAPAFAAGAKLEPLLYPTTNAEAAANCADLHYARLAIDIALMGMGEDGHTASWFAHAHGLERALERQSQHTVVAVQAPQAQGCTDRITLTRAALSKARRILLIIAGIGKRARLEQALERKDAPVAALFDAGMPKPEILWAP